MENGIAEKLLQLSEPGAVVTGPRLNLCSQATILILNLWPVATAPGSDGTMLIAYRLFVQPYGKRS